MRAHILWWKFGKARRRRQRSGHRASFREFFLGEEGRHGGLMTMAKPRMDLSAFVGKLLEEQDGDVLREGIRVLSQALMETEVAGLIGAERHERSGERTAYRNGTRTRTWDTRMGTIELAIPKVRPGTYFPSLLQPRRRAEHALLAVVQEAYVHGVSTRKVDDLVKALGRRRDVEVGGVADLRRARHDRRRRFGRGPLTGEHRVSVGRCDVPQGARRRARDQPGDGRRRGRDERRASGKCSGSMSGPSEDRAFWTAFLAQPGEARAQGRAAGDLGRARRLEAGHQHGADRDARGSGVACTSCGICWRPCRTGLARRSPRLSERSLRSRITPRR